MGTKNACFLGRVALCRNVGRQGELRHQPSALHRPFSWATSHLYLQQWSSQEPTRAWELAQSLQETFNCGISWTRGQFSSMVPWCHTPPYTSTGVQIWGPRLTKQILRMWQALRKQEMDVPIIRVLRFGLPWLFWRRSAPHVDSVDVGWLQHSSHLCPQS